jgi:hypothetical protein
MTLLEEIESRLALCAKATPKPWIFDPYGYAASVVIADNQSLVAMVGDNAQVETDGEFIAASRNQREGELAALKVALEKLNELDQTLRVPAAEYVPAIADAFTIIDQAITQITELMSEGK